MTIPKFDDGKGQEPLPGQSELYRARARLILDDPANNEDFCNILDALSTAFFELNENAMSELCTDLASVLESEYRS